MMFANNFEWDRGKQKMLDNLLIIKHLREPPVGIEPTTY